MRILLVHNFYQQSGGEDRVFAAEAELLEAHGHQVERYTEHNDDVDGSGKLSLAARTIWSRETTRKLGEVVDRFKPDVVHFHNTLPLISPSGYYAAARHGARIVQTLHNYRLYCPPSLFLRDGKICELCLGKTFAWPAIKYRCYRDNRSASTVVATMLAMHKTMGTYLNKIDVFIALTEFSRNKFIEGGLPADKIVVKPHFIESPEQFVKTKKGYALFVGRLSEEKGIQTLLNAWLDFDPGCKLVIVGDGPCSPEVERAAEKSDSIEWLGRKSPEEVEQLMAHASVAVLPSECYETFGRVIMESYATATPVVVSRIGAIAELVDDGVTGQLFEAGNAQDLSDRVRSVLQRSEEMGQSAVEYYKERFTPEANYIQLMAIYTDTSVNGAASNETPKRLKHTG